MLKRWSSVVAFALLASLAVGCCSTTSTDTLHFAMPPSDRQRPLIGITSVYIPQGDYVKVDSAYTRAIREAGGTPVILPVIDDASLVAHYVDVLDGLVLSGGDDVPPSAYGETPHARTATLSPKRHAFEKSMVEAWLRTDKPILGVCRGLQEINVVTGGTLVQDIPSQVGTKVVHRAPKGTPRTTHTVTVEEGSRLRALLGADTLEANCNHHQAAKDVGANLKVVARAADGLIEAMEFTDGRFGLLVQWHPERAKDAAPRKAIFGAFVQACRAAAVER